MRSIINCDENLAQIIISNTDEEIVNKMDKLFDLMFKLNQISDAESVMNNFIERLDKDDLPYDKEQLTGDEFKLDTEAIEAKVKSYKNLLNSPFLKEANKYIQ